MYNKNTKTNFVANAQTNYNLYQQGKVTNHNNYLAVTIYYLFMLAVIVGVAYAAITWLWL